MKMKSLHPIHTFFLIIARIMIYINRHECYSPFHWWFPNNHLSFSSSKVNKDVESTKSPSKVQTPYLLNSRQSLYQPDLQNDTPWSPHKSAKYFWHHWSNLGCMNTKGPSRVRTTGLLNCRHTLNHIAKRLNKQQGYWKWPIYLL